jgi:hypothetical protein
MFLRNVGCNSTDYTASYLRNSSVCIATGYGPDSLELSARFPVGAKDTSLLQSVQTSSESHPSSYTVGNGGYFHVSKATGA